jgi:glycerol-3-phosphate dehydrogenase subunit C
VTDCPLAALQFEQHAGKKPLHPMSLLARSYRAAEQAAAATAKPPDTAKPADTEKNDA